MKQQALLIVSNHSATIIGTHQVCPDYPDDKLHSEIHIRAWPRGSRRGE